MNGLHLGTWFAKFRVCLELPKPTFLRILIQSLYSLLGFVIGTLQESRLLYPKGPAARKVAGG